MRRVILTLLLLMVKCWKPTVAGVSFSSDETMQQFREEILEFQSQAMILVDESFFKLYNALYVTLDMNILQPYLELAEAFNQSCSKFPLYTLEAYAVRRLINICDEVERVTKRVDSIAEKIMSEFLVDPKFLTSLTMMGMMTEDYFASSGRHLEFVVPIYNQNPTCVLPLLPTFFTIYRKPIDNMIDLNLKMIERIPKVLRKDLKFIESSIAKLFGVSNKMANCSDVSEIDTFGCIRGFVDFDCLKRKSGCGPVYKAIYMIINHFQKMFYLNDIYENFLTGIDRAMNRVEAEMLAWSNLVDTCITS